MPPRDPDERPLGDERDEGAEIDLRSLRGAAPAGVDDDLARLGEIARSLTGDDLARDEPPPAVWAGIAARTGTAAADEPPSPPPLRPVEGGGPAAPPAPRHLSTGPVRGRAWGLAAAAAALVLVVVVGAVALARDGDDDGGSVVASAELEPLPDEPTGAASPTRADLVDHDGRLQLDLSTGDLPDADGFYEVWLIDTNVDGMVSLGPARADGTYSVPSGVDPAQFPIVDVSIEPPDGDPTHSGVSVLRGTLA